MRFDEKDVEALAEAVVERMNEDQQVRAKLPYERIGYPEAEAAELLGIPSMFYGIVA